jgi:hypothetical protein
MAESAMSVLMYSFISNAMLFPIEIFTCEGSGHLQDDRLLVYQAMAYKSSILHHSRLGHAELVAL